jgi:signal transduction histidine kinase
MIRLQLFQQPAITLPCPADACLELAMAFVAPDSQQSKIIHQTLRLNPSLLLLTLAQYQQAHQKPATNARKLVRWFQKSGIHFLQMQNFLSDSTGIREAKRSKRLLQDFLRARSRSKCQQSLNRWLKLHTSINKTDRKSILKSLLSKSFRLDDFRAKRVRRESTFDAAWASWNSDSPMDGKLDRMVDLVSRQVQLESEFGQSLQNEKLAAMKQLAYGASHEINNPLANVATRAQSLLIDETHPQRRTKLATIYQQAMRAHEMISDLMLFAHPPAMNIENISLRQLLRPFIGQLEQPDGLDDRIQIRFLIGPNVDRIRLDRTQFLVVLDAMIQNSRQSILAHCDHGEIEVRFGLVHGCDDRLPARLGRDESAEWLQVTIWDNGPAIDQRVRRHMFDPFFSGREAGRGLGFGLSKSWRVIQQHGGELHFDTSCKQGTRFVLWLPQNARARRANNANGRTEEVLIAARTSELINKAG